MSECTNVPRRPCTCQSVPASPDVLVYSNIQTQTPPRSRVKSILQAGSQRKPVLKAALLLSFKCSGRRLSKQVQGLFVIPDGSSLPQFVKPDGSSYLQLWAPSWPLLSLGSSWNEMLIFPDFVTNEHSLCSCLENKNIKKIKFNLCTTVNKKPGFKMRAFLKKKRLAWGSMIEIQPRGQVEWQKEAFTQMCTEDIFCQICWNSYFRNCILWKMLKTAIVGLGRGGTGCLRGGKRNLQLKNILEGRLRGICPIENIRTLATTLSKKNMALEVREELRKKASFWA